jgi:AcrR family transcriptional regulator
LTQELKFSGATVAPVMSEREATKPAARGKGAQTRQAILDAAVTRFARDGYRTTSVADIAREAGVGGTVAYAYFPNKEALFLAALDEDAAGAIHEAVSFTSIGLADGGWNESLLTTMVAAVERHPLARRVLCGLEPHVTDRMSEIPALAELRKAVAEQLRSDQAAGVARPDIDPVAIANGTVAISLALVMAALQFGVDGPVPYAADVLAVLAAAVEPAPPRADPPGDRR